MSCNINMPTYLVENSVQALIERHLKHFEKHLLRYFVDANMLYFEFPPASIQETSPE
jgi:hypothetical protein